MPLADDLLSLELDDAFSDLYLVCLIRLVFAATLLMTRFQSGKIRAQYSRQLKL
jgi:hypothetical protein